MSGMRDEELVRRYLAGDKGSFGELVRRHERKVYNLAYRMLGREEEARDATQDAFLSAMRKLAGFRGDAAFSTWLHRVTVNACYDILRKRKHEPLLERQMGEEEDARDHRLGRPEPSVGDHAEASITAIDVRRALMLVPEDFRVVLVLHDAQDLGYDEVAEILGVPVGTVKSRLHRGRIALARALGAGPSAGPREPEEAERPSETGQP
jgi:RNA polymerase sigma-70 factor (ECF subfamily)